MNGRERGPRFRKVQLASCGELARALVCSALFECCDATAATTTRRGERERMRGEERTGCGSSVSVERRRRRRRRCDRLFFWERGKSAPRVFIVLVFFFCTVFYFDAHLRPSIYALVGASYSVGLIPPLVSIYSNKNYKTNERECLLARLFRRSSMFREFVSVFFFFSSSFVAR